MARSTAAQARSSLCVSTKSKGMAKVLLASKSRSLPHAGWETSCVDSVLAQAMGHTLPPSPGSPLNCGISPVGLFGSPLWQASLVKATVTPQLPSKNPICWLPASWRQQQGDEVTSRGDGRSLDKAWSQGSADVCMVGAKPYALCPLPNLGQGTGLASVLSSAPSPWPAVRDAHRELGACWCAHGVSFHSPLVEQHHDHRPQRGSKNMPLVRTLTPRSLWSHPCPPRKQTCCMEWGHHCMDWAAAFGSRHCGRDRPGRHHPKHPAAHKSVNSLSLLPPLPPAMIQKTKLWSSQHSWKGNIRTAVRPSAPSFPLQ